MRITVAIGLGLALRPGGNLTGLTLSVGYEFAGKRVELLKDIKPDLVRLAVLKNPNNPTSTFVAALRHNKMVAPMGRTCTD